LTGEVVSGLESTRNALLDGRVPTVVGRQDGVLETSGVLKVNVNLAVLALLSNGDTRADRGDVGVEDEGDNGPVGGDLGAHGALRATGSSIGDTIDCDLVYVSRDSLERIGDVNVLDQLVEQYRAQLGREQAPQRRGEEE